MNWPQIVVIVILAMSVGISIVKDGEPRPPYSFVSTLVSACIWFGVLYAAGFWS